MKKISSLASLGTAVECDSLLQEALVRQFNNSPLSVRKRRFLGDVEREELSSHDGQKRELSLDPPIFDHVIQETKERAVSLQKWEGVVVEVRQDNFYAQLNDLTEQNPMEETELPIDEVSEDDIKLIKPGAIFYWSIGNLRTRTGQIMRTSIIKFRRMPAWSEQEIKSAKDKAHDLSQIIGWGHDNSEKPHAEDIKRSRFVIRGNDAASSAT